MLSFDEQQKMEKNGVIETRTERRTVITRDGDSIDHDKVTRSVSFFRKFLLFSISLFSLSLQLVNLQILWLNFAISKTVYINRD